MRQEVRPELELLFRTESARLTALLTGILGPAQLALAEDVTQEALLAALGHWSVEGIPANPSAWLLQVARRKALNAIRRDRSAARLEPAVVREFEAREESGAWTRLRIVVSAGRAMLFVHDSDHRGSAELRGERDSGCVENLYARYRANGTWVTPTTVNAIKDSASVNWATMALLDDESRRSCETTVALFDVATEPVRRRFHREFLEDLAHLHEAGVSILAGTDVPNPCLVPGASLHDELEWLVSAGFTPYEALRTATINPAIFLGAADSLGVVRTGRIADLVLLAANPLDDIRATRRVTAVVVGGRYFRPEALRNYQAR